MFRMKRELESLAEQGHELKLGLIGAGKMGASLLIQLKKLRGMKAVLVVDHSSEKAQKALESSGFNNILVTSDVDEAAKHVRAGGIVVSENDDLLYKVEDLDAVVEATGNPMTGAEAALKTIEANKHIIMLNVECDSAVGPILYEKALKQGVVYTGIKGDEPGAIIELIEFADNVGLEIVAVGKGKNNKLDIEATNETLREEAESKGLSPHMLCSFVDGTNTMTELTSLCNATGFIPDVPGLHGITTSHETIVNDLKLKDQGGILSQKGVVEYAFGMAPGVFALVTSDNEEIRGLMKYLGLGDGPNFLLYKPYHLTSMEAPITIYEALVHKEPSIAPIMGQVADAVTIAKRDLVKGESLKGIGLDTIYGQIVLHETQKENGYVPIALINEAAKAKVDIKKGDYLTWDTVELDEEATIVKLRREQDRNEA